MISSFGRGFDSLQLHSVIQKDDRKVILFVLRVESLVCRVEKLTATSQQPTPKRYS